MFQDSFQGNKPQLEKRGFFNLLLTFIINYSKISKLLSVGRWKENRI